MPELPEVETIRRSLEPLILHARIAAYYAYDPRAFISDLNPEICLGAEIVALRRHGKYLLIDLCSARGAWTLMAHFRMTGAFIVRSPLERLEKRVSFRFFLENAGPEALAFCSETDLAPQGFFLDLLEMPDAYDSGQDPSHLPARGFFLDFEDTRRFGSLKLFPAAGESEDPGFAALGLDALDPALSFEEFWKRWPKHSTRAIKSLLLDQHFVAGYGNIYADEALFRAKIAPMRRVASLTKREAECLYRIGRELLEEAIGHQGCSFRDYVDGLGRHGHFQAELAVYQREGLSCPRCGRQIEVTEIAGRRSRYCPGCQPKRCRGRT
ncbi:MAG: DNA-formamidopyrimidine glycosylase family protein [Eubacteriales bacterium]|nr:DNA-formamidopyrimidine glycosylase family protein [Eubacteriales bacterium]